ncbi:hypothetical protein ElyMa_005568200 [Elysia marginata]|uniref:Uncharacterized protein n=1 Tax=Elysia marginata TaxID=1093978 RepID=A0AAV4F1B5_9GAST|nr:hypothetical protein ElyMa_005568200 [Elysia marginata]
MKSLTDGTKAENFQNLDLRKPQLLTAGLRINPFSANCRKGRSFNKASPPQHWNAKLALREAKANRNKSIHVECLGVQHRDMTERVYGGVLSGAAYQSRPDCTKHCRHCQAA